jgi:hypothetical protein
MTTNIIYILFFIEIISVLLYFYYPQLIDLIYRKDGIVLLEKLRYLDIPTVLTGTDLLTMMETDSNNTTNQVFRKEYGISMWVYINPQPPNYIAYSKETPIFCYGNGKSGKPLITYYNNIEGESEKKDKLLFYFSDSSKHPDATIYIAKQKWNYIVVNYKNNICDVFINGVLEESVKLETDKYPIYSLGDNITIGSDNGIYGAICNCKFFFQPLTKINISNTQVMLGKKNPPYPIGVS